MVFQRSQVIKQKQFLNGLSGRKVITDAVIKIVYCHQKSKLRAWCEQVKSWLQFPKHLRVPDMTFVADIVEVSCPGKTTFYTVTKNTIRHNNRIVG